MKEFLVGLCIFALVGDAGLYYVQALAEYTVTYVVLAVASIYLAAVMLSCP